MQQFFFFFLFFVAMSFGSELLAQAELISGEQIAVAQTTSGKVRGYIHQGIYTYKGIPYAQAARFMPPAKVSPWEGIRSSTTYGPVAPLETPTTQVADEGEFVFDHDWGYPNEDCMRINIWTPGLADNKKRPVLFWIHGGGFTAGSSQELPSYDGENLSKKGDVVVVSINHRLNILGFLDLSAYGEPYKHSANLSLLDIVAALEWVKENIASFGGDPNNVTIFGQSGGGAKVNTLMAMPAAKGLFHKAINQSGSFRVGMLQKEDTQAIASALMANLGLSAQQVDSLQKIPFEQLVAAGKTALQQVSAQMQAAGKPVIGFGLSWGPSQDGEVLPYDLFSPEAFALSKEIPLLLGTTRSEFSVFMNQRFFKADEETVMAHIKATYKDKAADYLAAVKAAYSQINRPSDLLDVDAMFRPGAVAQANLKSALGGGAPVYMYLFAWESPVFDGKYRSVHCMEIPFVFDNVARANKMTGGGRAAHALADKMSEAWIAFAKSGNPNHHGLPIWPAYNSQNTATMHFNNHCEVQPQKDKALLELLQP